MSLVGGNVDLISHHNVVNMPGKQKKGGEYQYHSQIIINTHFLCKCSQN